jgi:Clr5 domain
MNKMASNPCELDTGHTRAVTPGNPRQLRALERNNIQWEAHKDEIWSLYIGQDMTLKATMAWFEMEHNSVKRQVNCPAIIG